MFKMPKIVAQRIVKLQRRFFWGVSANRALPVPTVKWSSIELPKNLGGLGVGNIMHKNLLLLFKWWWRFSDCDNTLWKRILISIYDIKGLKASKCTIGEVKSGIWGQLANDDTETTRIRDIVEKVCKLLLVMEAQYSSDLISGALVVH